MQRIRRPRPRVTLGPADGSLTPRGGLRLVAEIDRILGVTATVDARVGPTTARRRGLSAGELVLSMSETMLAGGDFMIDLEHQRGDVAGAPLRAVPEIPASATFIGRASASRRGSSPGSRRRRASSSDGGSRFCPTRGGPSSSRCARASTWIRPDVETYGTTKEGMSWNHAGQRVGRESGRARGGDARRGVGRLGFRTDHAVVELHHANGRGRSGWSRRQSSKCPTPSGQAS